MSLKNFALFGALLCAATPALADWDHIGDIRVQYRGDRATEQLRLGGPVERLELTADRSDMFCRSVRARFGNGRDREIYHGTLQRGQDVNVDLPGDTRTLRALSFNCAAQDRSGGVIRVSADIGRYRDEWRRSPDWRRTWSRLFNWGSEQANNWQLVGAEHFEGRGDSESTFAGWRGRQVDSVALKPLESDARCGRVTARFGNGRSRDLDINGGDVLRQGQYYKLDLPGDQRNLEQLSLRCRAMGARGVTLQIFVSH
jgi:hypothetical protein